MTRYLFLVTYPQIDWTTVAAADEAAVHEAHATFEAFVDQHGRQISSAPLADPDASTTVRHRDGAVVVTDGPFAETAEMIGGYYDVELPDLDTAIAAAALLPAQFSIEIRPTIRTGQ